MLAREFANSVSFNACVSSFLFENEFANNMLLSSMLALSQKPIQGVRYFAVESGGKAQVAAILTRKGRLVLASDSEEATSSLFDKLKSDPLTTIFLPSDVAGAVASKERFVVHGKQTLMKCEAIETPKVVEGFFRIASMKDFPLLTDWTIAFAKECRLEDTPSEAEDMIRRFIETKQSFIWENSKKAVSMAAFGGLTPRGARISLVYTKPGERNRGYAEILVHRLTHRILEKKDAVLLYADLANPTSVALYERLGFEKFKEFTEFRLRDQV